MTDGGRRVTLGTWLWLPVVTTAVLTPVMYGVGRASDPRSERAGAEPGIAGLMVAFPFAVLLVVALLAALGATAGPRARERALGVVTGVTVLVAALVVLVAVLDATTPSATVGRTVRFAAVALAVGLPLLPAWVAHLRERRAT